MKKFVLLVRYGYGEAAMITDTPDILKATMEFKHHYMKMVPDTKEFGMPEITKVRLVPIMYDSIYEREKENNEN